jgi:hypothetical protein
MSFGLSLLLVEQFHDTYLVGGLMLIDIQKKIQDNIRHQQRQLRGEWRRELGAEKAL